MVREGVKNGRFAFIVFSLLVFGRITEVTISRLSDKNNAFSSIHYTRIRLREERQKNLYRILSIKNLNIYPENVPPQLTDSASVFFRATN